MCGRYRAQASARDVEKLWKVPANEAAEATFERIEVNPTTTVAVLAAGDERRRSRRCAGASSLTGASGRC